MPVQTFQILHSNKLYSHIDNKEFENRNLFNNQQDYEVFLCCLKNYLTSLIYAESIKKYSLFKDRVFVGKAHQPNNYFNKFAIISYSTRPNNFYLFSNNITMSYSDTFIKSHHYLKNESNCNNKTCKSTSYKKYFKKT